MTLNLHPSITEHWHCRYEDLQLSSNDFYAALEKELKAKAFPRVEFERKDLSESGFLSRRREYLLVTSGQYQFVICAAPFGRNFFFSWYLKEYVSFLCYLPLVGNWILRREMTKTYFELDNEIMFKESVKQVVDGALRELEKSRGIRDNQHPVASAN